MLDDIFTTSVKPDEVTPEIVSQFIRRHINNDLTRLQMLYDYYCGKQEILDRTKEKDLANNRLVINHAAYIADFTSGYLLGTPVTYSDNDEDIGSIIETLEGADAATQDADIALDAAIFGRAYEFIYAVGDNADIKLARLSPLNSFVVYDDTVEQKPVFGVYYSPVYSISGSLTGFKGLFATDKYTQNIELNTGYGIQKVDEPVDHFFGKVPIDEIYNNGQRFGDFEKVLSLIDAYNLLQSDRVNDKEQFVNALLVIKGQILGDTQAEKQETYEGLKTSKVMELAPDGEAAFLTRQFDESSVEVLKTSIVNDIHKISAVPDMSDQNFAGNTSGVAMRYKLLALEQLAKVKQRYFTEGLKYRIECIANFLTAKGAAAFDLAGIQITFKRSLPANELEQAQLVATLQGLVPQDTLLSQLDFVTDVDGAVQKLEEEQQAAQERALQAQAAMMKLEMNTPIKQSDV